MRHVAVVGAAGRLGQAVTRDLIDWGYQVRAVDRVPLAGADAGGSAGAGAGSGGAAGGSDNPWQGIAGELCADVRDRTSAEAAVAAADAVVFVAGLFADPAGRDDPGAALASLVQALWQTANAAGKAGSKRFVLASSTGVYGMNSAGKPWLPLYFPIDERHPTEPRDWAGLAHWLMEETLAQLAREHRFASVCLRLPQLVQPSGYAALRARQTDAASGAESLWTYLDVRDAARALRLALEAPEQLLAEAMGGQQYGQAAGGHLVLNVVAATSISPRPTVELLTEFYADAPVQAARLPGQAPPITGERAAKTLGFEPRYGWVSHGRQ